MRAYAGATREMLEELGRGASLTLELIVPDGEDEIDEFNAMQVAADAGPVVIAADVDDTDQAVGLDDVAAWHVDADGSGFLAWYATQELGHVIALLDGEGKRRRGRHPLPGNRDRDFGERDGSHLCTDSAAEATHDRIQ